MSAPSARRTPHRRRQVLPATLTTVVLALVLGACSSKPEVAPKPSPTPITSVDAAALHLPRIAFCSLVPQVAVRDALGTKADAATSWGNGDRTAVTATTTDLVQEIGCEWRRSDGARARAWVFAEPVTTAFAGSVVAATRAQPGCRVVAGPAFGSPATTQVCRQAGAVRVRHAGLFGQTWLSCEVTREPGVPAPEVTERADAWCVRVAQALDGGT